MECWIWITGGGHARWYRPAKDTDDDINTQAFTAALNGGLFAMLRPIGFDPNTGKTVKDAKPTPLD